MQTVYGEVGATVGGDSKDVSSVQKSAVESGENEMNTTSAWNTHITDPEMIPGYQVERPVGKCSECWSEIFEGDQTHEVNGKTVCYDCVKMCDYCCEYINDEDASKGVGVLLRDWNNEGRKMACHALCAAGGLIRDISNEELDEDSGKEEIATLFEVKG